MGALNGLLNERYGTNYPTLLLSTNCCKKSHQENPGRDHDDRLLPRIRSLALSAIIKVEALRLAEIIRGMIEASITRNPCNPCTRNWSSTTAQVLPAGPMRQVQPGWNVVVPRWVAAARNSSSLCTLGPGNSPLVLSKYSNPLYSLGVWTRTCTHKTRE